MWTLGMVEVARMFDAEHCPDQAPDGYQAALVYAGGSSAAHAWDGSELARVAHLPRLPTWVPTPGRDHPITAGNEFVQWLLDHGVPAIEPTTGQRTRVMWDMETGKEPDPIWLEAASDVLALAGYCNLPYGSLSTLFGQPPLSGYMVANPSDVPHLFARADVVGTQYRFGVPVPGGTVDEWLITHALLRQLWQPAA